MITASPSSSGNTAKDRRRQRQWCRSVAVGIRRRAKATWCLIMHDEFYICNDTMTCDSFISQRRRRCR